MASRFNLSTSLLTICGNNALSTTTFFVYENTHHDVGSQLHLDAAFRRASDGDIEKDDRVFTHGS